MKAFPNYEWNETYKQMMPTGGMDLRDYFAAKAMQSLVLTRAPKTATQLAYKYADEMMKAREQK